MALKERTIKKVKVEEPITDNFQPILDKLSELITLLSKEESTEIPIKIPTENVKEIEDKKYIKYSLLDISTTLTTLINSNQELVKTLKIQNENIEKTLNSATVNTPELINSIKKLSETQKSKESNYKFVVKRDNSNRIESIIANKI